MKIELNGRKFKDYTGMKWGRLTAIKLGTPPRYKNSTYWVFKCDCGKKTEIPIDRVIEGKTQILHLPKN